MSRRDSRSMPSPTNISKLPLSVLAAAALLALPAAAYEAVQVSDGGSIKGKVLYQGEIATKKIIPTKDAETCGAMREEPLIVVGSDKGVQDAVVYLKEVQKGAALPNPAKKPEINNHNCQFEPHVVAINPSDYDPETKKQKKTGQTYLSRLGKNAGQSGIGFTWTFTRMTRNKKSIDCCSLGRGAIRGGIARTSTLSC